MHSIEHIGVGVFLFLLFFGTIFFGFPSLLPVFGLNEGFSFLVFCVGVALYISGLILPDSDKFGSKIYWTPFLPFAVLLKFLEIPLAAVSGRPLGHRESLHTVFGIAVSSFVISLIFSAVICFVLQRVLEDFFFAFSRFFVFLFLGQLIHLLTDFKINLI